MTKRTRGDDATNKKVDKSDKTTRMIAYLPHNNAWFAKKKGMSKTASKQRDMESSGRWIFAPPWQCTRPTLWCLVFLATLLLIGCKDTSTLASEDQDSAEVHKVEICHVTDNGTFTLITESRDTMPTHLLHGDGLVDGPVPGMKGYVFAGDCVPKEDVGDGPCQPGMAHIDDFCIDRWEAHLQDWSPYDVPDSGMARTAQGTIPQGYISGLVAEAACQAAGKRLCTSPEWLRACQGPAGTTYPYGSIYSPGTCNEGRTTHPVIELFGDEVNWSPVQMNDPRLNQLPNSLDATGINPVCTSVEGVYDLHGNLHEWVADASGTFRGGFYVDAKINGMGCLYRTTAHSRPYHDYSTGFRCCADPQ